MLYNDLYHYTQGQHGLSRFWKCYVKKWKTNKTQTKMLVCELSGKKDVRYETAL